MEDMIAAIRNKRVMDDTKAINEAIAKANHNRELRRQIKELAPRLSKMLEVANELVANGYRVGKYSSYANYMDNATDGIRHHIGFYVGNPYWGDSTPTGYYGVENGGACGETDFKIWMATGEVIEGGELTTDLEYFLKGFDEAEQKFYDYVKALVA